jgi:hypothetical protein
MTIKWRLYLTEREICLNCTVMSSISMIKGKKSIDFDDWGLSSYGYACACNFLFAIKSHCDDSVLTQVF